MGWFGLAVAALAAYRAARFVAADTITEPARESLARWAWRYGPADPDDEPLEVPVPRAGAWRTWLVELVSCQWCVGLWLAPCAWALWTYGGDAVAHPLLLVLAIAGAQGFLASRGDS